MKAWANILFLLFVIFLGMFMTHLVIRHERIREQFRGSGGVGQAISRAGGTANSPLDGAPIEGYRGGGGIGGSGGHGGGNIGGGGGHAGGGLGIGRQVGHIGGGHQVQTHSGHYAFQHGENQGRHGWHEHIEQPHFYPGGGANISRNWMGSGGGDGWWGYGWPFFWWGPAWYPEYTYICNKDSDCAVGKCSEAGFCVV